MSCETTLERVMCEPAAAIELSASPVRIEAWEEAVVGAAAHADVKWTPWLARRSRKGDVRRA